MTHLPVDFSAKAQSPSKPGQAGYPYALSAADLMANFHSAVLSAEPFVNGSPQPFCETQVSVGQHSQRVIMINPPPPTDGKTYVFAFSGGAFKWLPTEEC